MSAIAINAVNKQYVVAGVFFVVLSILLSFQVVLADQHNFTRDTGELGCVVREPGSIRFLHNDLSSKEEIGEAVIEVQRLRGFKVIDPCLSGQVKNIPATIYAALAKHHSNKYQLLDINDKYVIDLKKAMKGIMPQYRYVGLNEFTPPGFLLFTPSAISNDNRVYGNVFVESNDTFNSFVAVVEHDILTVFQEGFANSVNESGLVGGWVLTDAENFVGQAALFHEYEVQLIPRLPREIHSEVLQINDAGMALIFSIDENFSGTIALYYRNQLTPLDFGPDIQSAFFIRMNNQGVISGTTFIDGLGYRGFRFDPRSGLATLLHPLPSEPHAWALDINNRGDILGYSFIFSATERVGVWDKLGTFHTYFVEGTQEFPTISNALRFNDNNFIVITSVSSPLSERGNSYIVPKPDVRLNLADLVIDMPPEHGSLWHISAINNRTSMIGFTLTPDFSAFDFLLKRISIGRK